MNRLLNDLGIYDCGKRGCFDDFANGLCNLFATFDHILKHASTDYVAQRCLCALYQRLSQVRDTECGFVRRGDVVVDDRCEGQIYVVLRHADLLWDFDDLNLHIDLNEVLGEGVDFDETRIDCAGESTEFRYEAYVSLGDLYIVS